MKLQIIVVTYDDGENKRSVALRGLIDSFLLQTNPDWIMTIIHDGPATQAVKAILKLYDNDQRICWLDTETRVGFWGLENKKKILSILKANPGDFVLFSNDDNYYVPAFVGMMMEQAAIGRTGFVYCDFLHHNIGYEIIRSRPETNSIDMGAFITDLSLAQEVSFPYMIPAHDGKFAEEATAICKKRSLRIAYIPKVLFVHN